MVSTMGEFEANKGMCAVNSGYATENRAVVAIIVFRGNVLLIHIEGSHAYGDEVLYKRDDSMLKTKGDVGGYFLPRKV